MNISTITSNDEVKNALVLSLKVILTRVRYIDKDIGKQIIILC